MRMLLLLLWLQGFGPDIEVWRRLEAFAAFARTEIEDSALMNRWSGGFGAHGLSAYRIGIGFGRHPVRPGGVMLGSTVPRSEEHTSEIQSLLRNSFAGFRLKI